MPSCWIHVTTNTPITSSDIFFPHTHLIGRRWSPAVFSERSDRSRRDGSQTTIATDRSCAVCITRTSPADFEPHTDVSSALLPSDKKTFNPSETVWYNVEKLCVCVYLIVLFLMWWQTLNAHQNLQKLYTDDITIHLTNPQHSANTRQQLIQIQYLKESIRMTCFKMISLRAYMWERSNCLTSESSDEFFFPLLPVIFPFLKLLSPENLLPRSDHMSRQSFHVQSINKIMTRFPLFHSSVITRDWIVTLQMCLQEEHARDTFTINLHKSQKPVSKRRGFLLLFIFRVTYLKNA